MSFVDGFVDVGGVVVVVSWSLEKNLKRGFLVWCVEEVVVVEESFRFWVVAGSVAEFDFVVVEGEC